MISLADLITEYAEAGRAFNTCPDMLMSSETLMKDPEKSMAISNRFFSARKALFERVKNWTAAHIETPLEKAAFIWGLWHKTADSCPTLCLIGHSKMAAQIMEQLGAAEHEMLTANDHS